MGPQLNLMRDKMQTEVPATKLTLPLLLLLHSCQSLPVKVDPSPSEELANFSQARQDTRSGNMCPHGDYCTDSANYPDQKILEALGRVPQQILDQWFTTNQPRSS